MREKIMCEESKKSTLSVQDALVLLHGCGGVSVELNGEALNVVRCEAKRVVERLKAESKMRVLHVEASETTNHATCTVYTYFSDGTVGSQIMSRGRAEAVLKMWKDGVSGCNEAGPY
jgi:hypothetical protein